METLNIHIRIVLLFICSDNSDMLEHMNILFSFQLTSTWTKIRLFSCKTTNSDLPVSEWQFVPHCIIIQSLYGFKEGFVLHTFPFCRKAIVNVNLIRCQCSNHLTGEEVKYERGNTQIVIDQTKDDYVSRVCFLSVFPLGYFLTHLTFALNLS